MPLIMLTWILLSALLGLSCSQHEVTDKSQSLTFIKISPKQDTRRLVVFIHGILGDSETTWTNTGSKAYWPQLIASDQELSGYDVAVASYPSPVCEQTSNIPQIAARLRERFTAVSVFEKYDELYIISHSMGGLITKKFLIDLDHRGETDALSKIKTIFLMATPSQGAPLSRLAAHFCKSSQITDMEALHMNTWLQELETDWSRLIEKRNASNNKFPKAFCAYEILQQTTSIIVPQEYATTRCDNEPLGIESSHIDIVKPVNRDSDSYVWVRSNVLKTASNIGLEQLGRGQQFSPTYAIEETIWIIDLTTRIPIPEKDRERLFSEVSVERRDRFEKRTDKNEAFMLYYGTSGHKIEWEGRIAPARHEFKELVPDPTFRTPLKHSYNYILHIADKPAGFRSEILNRYTFFNGFQGDREEWWSAELKYQTQKAVAFFAFPLNKPCKRITVYRKHADENKEEITDNVVMITPGGKYAYWTGANLKGASKIIFQWEW